MSGDLQYIPRIRAYYQALGYGAPYEWAHFEAVPFARMSRPLRQARVAIVTTAAPVRDGFGDQGAGADYNGAAKFFEVYRGRVVPEPVLGISHIAYDRVHTTAADQGSFFPLRALQRLAADGEIGGVAPHFYGLPTNRSQRRTLEVDGPDLVAMCRDDGVDVALMVPNCPVCHQSVALAARALEAAGIVTVVMGCARDIVEHVGVPRLLFSNFPLGNGAGLPDDPASQLETAWMAVRLARDAAAARTTRQSPVAWSGVPDWQKDYSNADLLSEAEIAARRAAFDRGKRQAKKVQGETQAE